MKKASLLLRKEIAKIQPRVCGDIETARRSQDAIGALEAAVLSGKVKHIPQHRGAYEADFAVPVKHSSKAALMYIHGGGYTAGTLDYARGFGSVLAELTGLATLCVAYRLAPEHPYPAALDDVWDAYAFMRSAFPDTKLVIVGESAGGGLCYALCLKAKREGVKLPDGIVAMSPWTDLTLSFPSHTELAEDDPALSNETLEMFAQMYAPDNRRDPFVSPVFGDLSGLPESLIYVGSCEILRDDSVMLANRLREAGCRVTLKVEEGAWHAYVLYATYEARCALKEIKAFIKRTIE